MTTIRNISVTGSTGSIGVKCLDVAAAFPDRFRVVGLAAGRNVERLAKQIECFRPLAASVTTEEDAAKLKAMLGPDIPTEIHHGDDGLCRVAGLSEADTLVSAVVGAAGLKPTWTAIMAGKRIALANKETLVMAGELVMPAAAEHHAEILPVDSEHSAIFQALCGYKTEDVKRLILTASGGPFHGWTMADLRDVTPRQALAHPNWSMGAKISIDSATLMNKGLEAIEARWLFGLGLDRIDILIHRQSIVHSMVEFIDGSVLAQMGIPDMRLPIAYALSYPRRLPLKLPRLELTQTGPLTFGDPDLKSFPCLALALETGRRGGVGPSVLNAANEVAVAAFLDGRIRFTDIVSVVQAVVAETGYNPIRDIDHVLAADQAARQRAREVAADLSRRK